MALLVSIIIPVFNVLPYLNEALDSVMNQSYKKLEVILIDDGSTDGSSIICDKYKEIDKRFRVIHQDNKGLSAARNVGLDMMTGDLVAFLDSDDVYYPDFVKEMVTAFIDTKADLVVCKYSFYQSGIRGKKRKERLFPAGVKGIYDHNNILLEFVNFNINPNVWNKIYKESLWEHVRFPQKHVYEDIETICKILDRCSYVYVLDKPLYVYRKRKDSITSTCSPSNILDGIRAINQLLIFINENTPELFTIDQLKYNRLLLLKTMIKFYARCSKKERAFRKKLRNQIIKIGAIIGIDKYDFHSKIKASQFTVLYKVPGG